MFALTSGAVTIGRTTNVYSRAMTRYARVMANVWQIGAGDFGRDYSGLFKEHDLMFMGPGHGGRYDEALYQKHVADEEVTPSEASAVRSFCQRVQAGDTVLMRRGHRVIAIGRVHEEGYSFNPVLDDVYGWDLQHAHRVMWQSQLEAALVEAQKSGDLFSHMKQIATFTGVNNGKTLSRVEHLFSKCTPRQLAALPTPVPPGLGLDELGAALRGRSVTEMVVTNILRVIERQRQLLKLYRTRAGGGRPNEHEVVAYLVLPLLFALGWTEEQLALEWNNIDVAGFSGPATSPEHCVMVCEAKAMNNGLSGVLAQAVGYYKQHDLKNCRRILITQGSRFCLYTPGHGGEWIPSGYINVENIRVNHIMPAGTSAIDTLLAMMP